MKTMKILKSIAAAAVMAAALVSCSSDDILTPAEPETPAKARTITVNLVQSETRTALDADAKLRWQTGDEVSYFTSADGSAWSKSKKATIDAATGSFSAEIPDGDSRIIVIYPAVENGTEYAESLASVKQTQTYGSPLPLPMSTAATAISEGAQTVNAPYTVNGAVVKLTVTGVEASDIKAVCLGRYTCQVPDGQASDGTFFVVLPLGQTEYTPAVLVDEGGTTKTYRRIEPKTSTFTAKAYEMAINVDDTEKYGTMTGWFVDNGDGTGTLNGHAWVDLGITTTGGKKLVFADRNIGANSPENYGNYYLWATLKPYPAANETGYTIETLRANGVIDENNRLTSAYDVATVTWGEGWRTPTGEEMGLLGNISRADATINKINGWNYTGNSNVMFIPKSGRKPDDWIGQYAEFWCSNIHSDNLPVWASVNTIYEIPGGAHSTIIEYKSGRAIRPVTVIK